MQQLMPYFVSIAIALASAALVVGGGLYLLRRSRKADGELAAFRQANMLLERDLAVERERSCRIPDIEKQRDVASAEFAQEREARARVEQDLAAMREARSQAEAVIYDLKTRATKVEVQNAEDAAKAAEVIGDLQQQLSAAKAQLAALTESLGHEKRQTDEKLKLIQDARDTMTKQFQVLANDLMSQHGETFTKQNKEQLGGLLTPLHEKLKEFRDGLQHAHIDGVQQRAVLGEQIRQLSEQSARMTSETVNLTRALKGEAQTRGAWGEMVLATLLRKCGLREGEEYVTQASHSTEEGERLRPDVIVNLPGGQHVIIDSKVSLVAFEAHVNAETENDRSEHLQMHLVSMRAHIKKLASKEYQRIAGHGLDYVIMFVPIEGALVAALQTDPALTTFAVENNVMISGPTNLMVALRTIDNVWKVERRNQNAEEIARRAGLLYSKFVKFVEDMQALGNRLNQAQSTYQDAMGKLQTGSGNLIGQADKLRELGAKTSKSLPKGIVVDEGLGEITSGLIAGGLDGPAEVVARDGLVPSEPA